MYVKFSFSSTSQTIKNIIGIYLKQSPLDPISYDVYNTS